MIQKPIPYPNCYEVESASLSALTNVNYYYLNKLVQTYDMHAYPCNTPSTNKYVIRKFELRMVSIDKTNKSIIHTRQKIAYFYKIVH